MKVVVRRLLLAMGLLASVVAVGTGASVPSASAVSCTSLCAGGEFHPLDTPVRVHGSRTLMGTSFSVDVLSGWLDPSVAAPSDVLGVMATVNVVLPRTNGWLKAFPTGGAVPVASALALKAGQSISNLTLLRTDATGRVTIATSASSGAAPTAGVDVVVYIDVVGWYSTSNFDAVNPSTPNLANIDPAAFGSRLVPLGSPVRVLATTMNTTTPVTVPVTGSAVVAAATGALAPSVAGNITAVLLNIGTASATANTGLAVVPEAVTPPGKPVVRSLTATAGVNRSNLVLAKVGSNGSVRMYLQDGTTTTSIVRADVVAVFVASPQTDSATGRVIPLNLPFRVFDTRSAAFGAVPLGPNQAEDWSFAAFSNSVNIGGVPVGAQGAVLGNLTNMSLARAYPTVAVTSGLTAYRPEAARPLGQQLATYEATPVANMMLMPYGANQVERFHNRAGYAHYLLDVYAVVLS